MPHHAGGQDALARPGDEERRAHERRVDAARIATLYAQAPKVLIANVVNAAIVAAILWFRPGADRPMIIGWVAVMVTMAGVRAAIGRSFHPDIVPRDLARWARRFTLGSLASGALWGGCALAMFPSEDLAGQVLLAFVIGGMAAGASSSTASHLPAFYAFLVPALVPLIVRLAIEGTRFHLGMAAMVGLFGVLVAMIGRTTHATVVESYRLSVVNETLAQRLGEAHHELEQNNLALEARVRARTEELEKQTAARHTAEKLLHRAQRLETVGRLTGGVAHDFNNLLTVIVSSLDAFEHAPDDPRSHELLLHAREAALRGGDLTRSLLAFSRRDTMRAEVVDVGSVVERLTGTIVRRALSEKIALEVELSEPSPAIEVDPALLESAVLNLVINARDAMPNGGRLRVQVVSPHLQGDAELAAGDYVEITVSDSGTGIDPAALERVFDPFFTTKGESGTGLGLSMVYGFAAEAGGAIRLESEVGVGTTARLLLPRSKACPHEYRHRAQSLPRGCGESVLLVEDDPSVRALTERSLTSLGYHPIPVSSADDALRTLAEHPEVALVLSDIVMPGELDGIDLAREVADTRPDLPVVLASGYADVALDRDAFTVLSKPYRRADLARTLRAALDGT